MGFSEYLGLGAAGLRRSASDSGRGCAAAGGLEALGLSSPAVKRGKILFL